MFSPRDARGNLKWYLIFRISFDFALWGPIWVLYMTEELGLSFTQLMVFDALFQAGVVLLEIPTGIIADGLGRRWSLRCSAVAMALSMALWALADSYWWILGAWFFWAFALPFMDGADAALIYESLVADGRGDKFGRTLGRFTTYSMIGQALAALIGGWLAEWGFRTPIFAHLAVLMLTIFASFRLRDPPRTEILMPARPRQILGAMKAMLAHSARLRILLLYAAAVQVVVVLMFIYQQPMLVGAGLRVEHLGIFYSATIFLTALGPVSMTWASSRFGIVWVLGIGALGVALSSFALFALPGLLVVFPFILLRLLGAGIVPVTIDGMNRLVGPRGRATVLSLRSMTVSALVGPMEVVSGWWADRVPLRRIFLVCGVTLPVVVGALGWLWKRRPERVADPVEGP